MGEIEQKENSSEVFLNARVVKMATGFHKIVYDETTKIVNGLIEAITTRNKNFKKQTEQIPVETHKVSTN